MTPPLPAAQRHTLIVDVHTVLIRGGHVLLMRRAGTGYADGLLGLPSGHLEQGEDVVTAAIREAHEETGVRLDRRFLDYVHVMHRKPGDGGLSRVGFFFQSRQWIGEPANLEPHKCSELIWHPIDRPLPKDTIPYLVVALHQIYWGSPFSVYGWRPSDARLPWVLNGRTGK